MSVKLIAIGKGTGGSWGIAFILIVNEARLIHRSLLGLTGDSGTGSVWLDILFIQITLRHG